MLTDLYVRVVFHNKKHPDKRVFSAELLSAFCKAHVKRGLVLSKLVLERAGNEKHATFQLPTAKDKLLPALAAYIETRIGVPDSTPTTAEHAVQEASAVLGSEQPTLLSEIPQPPREGTAPIPGHARQSKSRAGSVVIVILLLVGVGWLAVKFIHSPKERKTQPTIILAPSPADEIVTNQIVALARKHYPNARVEDFMDNPLRERGGEFRVIEVYIDELGLGRTSDGSPRFALRVVPGGRSVVIADLSEQRLQQNPIYLECKERFAEDDKVRVAGLARFQWDMRPSEAANSGSRRAVATISSAFGSAGFPSLRLAPAQQLFKVGAANVCWSALTPVEAGFIAVPGSAVQSDGIMAYVFFDNDTGEILAFELHFNTSAERAPPLQAESTAKLHEAVAALLGGTFRVKGGFKVETGSNGARFYTGTVEYGERFDELKSARLSQQH